jgi:phage/plasmid-associated DNA primase
LYIAPSIERAKEEYKREQDVIGQFIKEECETGKEFTITKALLYQTYASWAKQRNFFVKNDREFSQELTKRVELKEARPGTDGPRKLHWIGIRTIQLERKF